MAEDASLVAERPRRVSRPVLAAVGAACVGAITLLVLRDAWVTDDALITLRYVQNTLHGLGLVFNPGERVQGYTHPLWFLLLLAGTSLYSDPYLVAIALGVLLSAVTVTLVVVGVARLSPEGWQWPTALLTGLVVVLASSPSWIAFQTSGLENVLTHLLIVCWIFELFRRPAPRAGLVVLLSSLICLSRPDTLFLVAPAGLLVLWRTRDVNGWIRVGLGAAPALAWIAFAWAYYGTPVPNTATAKLGIFRERMDALHQGLVYVLDWALYEPVALTVTVVGFWLLMREGRTAWVRALALGIACQVGWVVWIGGDFMRGRFLLAPFTAATVGALFALAAYRRPTRNTGGLVVVAALALAVLLAERVGPEPRPGVNLVGIADEWLVYRGYHLVHVRRLGRLYGRPDLMELVADLRRYTDRCGPVTIHTPSPAFIGFESGPQVRIVDLFGLTDAYVAALPADFLVQDRPRPGHPYKKIPKEYLWGRDDVSLLSDWRSGIAAGDCSLTERVRQGGAPSGYFVPVPTDFSKY